MRQNIISLWQVRFWEFLCTKHIDTRELPRVRTVWNAIPIQLAKENKKFFFDQVKKGARAKDFELAVEWLVDCGLISKVNRVSKPAMPLKAYAQENTYKLFFLDIGLLSAISALIEVKAEQNLRAKSLRAYYDKYKPAKTIRLSMSPYREQDWVENIPLFAIHTL